MDYRILGPLEVSDEGRIVAVGGRSQRALLTLLLLHLNETLSTDVLIDGLWGEKPPASAARTVYVHISRLRKALAGGRAESDGALVTRERGYQLTIDPDRLDAHRFEQLVADGGRELADGRPERAGDTLKRALGLWRGAVLAEFAYKDWAQSEITRLNELREVALEQQVETDLALGRHADVVGRLPALITKHPYREHLRAQLMLALFRCDRQADALQAYQDARHALVDELGIEPGERLRELERAILAQDPALALPVPAAAPAVEIGTPDEEREPPPAPARRLVSVLVSTALAELPDPESVHDVLTRRSELCADVLERHGGTVEKLSGDTVVGVFGLRSLHEDDALRAVRAALELRAACAELGAAMERKHGIRIAVTFGISSGEVFVGAGPRGETVATGEAMKVAEQLDGAAGDGEILLSERTHGLVTPHVQAEPLGPLSVRGRQGSVAAYRLLDLRSAVQAPLAPATGPFIGREHECAELRDLLARAAAERACHLVTVSGPPGIGKSRLASEFAAGIADEATVVVGQCLSYGDGITYRPLADMVQQLVGPDPEHGIAQLLAGEDVTGSIARRVLGAIGLADESAQASETFWAVRRLFEAAARERPFVAIIEDAHWAEPTLLELLEYVVSFSSGSPILLVCLARPEFLLSHPTWSELPPVRRVLPLERLNEAEAEAFVQTLAAGELKAGTTERIVETAEGNPLFLEQLVAVGAEGDLASLPPSIEAVLAARIEQLEPDERRVLVHASVEGRSFHGGSVEALMSESAIAAPLMGLVRKQLVRPERPEFAGEDGFRFSHALIREAAYCGMPKRLRADLHERLAGWLETKPRVTDEILGYHLEQAVVLRREIGAASEHDRTLATQSADRLASAARAALARGDAAAGARLLERAESLLGTDDPGRAELLSTLGAALGDAGRLADADRVLEAAIERAGLDADARIESRALVDQQLLRLHAGTSGGLEQARQVADVALAHLDRHEDHVGRSRAWRLRAWSDWIECQSAKADEAWGRAATHARRAGIERELFDILGWRASAAVFGPTPVDAAIRLCTQIREEVRSSPVAVAVTLHPLGLLHAMRGEFDEARRLIGEGNEILGELGRMHSAVSHHEAFVEMLSGRPEEAEARLRPGYDKLGEMGERELRATTAALLARAVYAQDRLDEAEELCLVCERIVVREDIATQIMWRGVRAKIHARWREAKHGEALAREAVALAEPTDLLAVRADALLDLAHVLGFAGRPAEAEVTAHAALELYERKGDVVSAARARSVAGEQEVLAVHDAARRG